jgi:hypothetical protein
LLVHYLKKKKKKNYPQTNLGGQGRAQTKENKVHMLRANIHNPFSILQLSSKVMYSIKSSLAESQKYQSLS